ncbi:MAG TPA: hypothetical protein VGM87_17420 [Roseomonas sp.]|jgi:hypothetical protein
MARDADTILADAETVARQAKAVLDQPGLQRAFAQLEAQYLTQIRHSDPAHGQPERESAFLMLRALDALRADLAAAAAGAAIAHRNLRFAANRQRRS